MSHNSHKPITSGKISHSLNVKIGIIILLLTAFSIIQIFIYFLFEDIYLVAGIFAFLFVLLSSFNSLCVNVGMNTVYILMNAFSGKARAVFGGFHFKLPWENLQYQVDLEVGIHSDITETFPIKTGSMQATVSILSKPDFKKGKNEKERSELMITYVSFEAEAIKGMQEAVAKKILREKFASLTSEEAKDSKSDDLLKKDDFADLEKTLAIEIIKCAVKDVDYNDEELRAQNSIMKATALGKMKEALVKSGYSESEAKAIAPLLDKDINLTKQINDINVNGLGMSPELIKGISKLFKNVGGK